MKRSYWTFITNLW